MNSPPISYQVTVAEASKSTRNVLAFPTTPPAQERLLNARVAAAHLGVSERWVRDHTTRRSPKIRAVKLGSLIRYRRADVEIFIEIWTLSTLHDNLDLVYEGIVLHDQGPEAETENGMAMKYQIIDLLAPEVGLEPTTLRLTAECSAIELLRSVIGTRITHALRFYSYSKCR